MNSSSLQQFELDLQGQAQRHEALIIDVRFNGGGNTDQQKIHLLERKPYGWWGLRGEPLRPVPLWHGRGYDGPMCCLINEGSRSDAEVFPNAFRERGLGKLIGMPTPGWIIFTRNYTLVNGHGFRVPRWGWYRLDGVDLELTGVEPDIRVDWPYEAYRDGEDPQLRAAVDHLLEELEETGRAQRPEIPGYRYDIVP
jgi:tricorn protease